MFRLPKEYADQIIAHVEAEAPNEGCGLLAGVDGRILKHYLAANSERSPVLYSIDAKELLGYIRDIDAQGWDLLAIYHSHTHSEAYPSATDVKLAYYPDAVYLIISLREPQRPAVRGFRIVDGVISEEEVTLTA
ncbi:MAG TPA: M67 family metallopeptidase [Dehalococcoidia bacterium]|nr:M67 family metallopeptidase [Dehalococcoidia bacterium]